MGDVEVLDGLPDFFHMGKDFFRLVPQGEGHKLLAAVAGEKICLAVEMGGRRLCHRGDHLVPGGVAEGVVIALKVVDVKHADGERHLQPRGLMPLCYAVLLIPAAVGDSGELVGHGLLLHLPAVVIQLDMGVHPGRAL